MKILVLGAGAVGGYFGGRLVEKGEDVTFLVREARQKQLTEHGLVINSVHGDVKLQPKTILAGEAVIPFDLILFATKSYHFHNAIEAIKPYIGDQTLILPLLNGYQHFDQLKEMFGQEKILGGLCFVEATLNENGEVVQTSPTHQLSFGELKGGTSVRVEAIREVFSGTKTVFHLSENIVQDIWHKYLFITTLSGITTLMRSAIGPIREEGETFIEQLFEETATIMRAVGAPIADGIERKHMETVRKQSYTMKSSMLRDMEKSYPTEADHIQGYLLQLAEQHRVQAPLLTLVYRNLRVYEKNN
ncbi:ketopantoate reductase family protein [Anaerobacillus alkaliphilus]|uniref:2-dehydropantoate 2-reductase n=1 Tax=Anaerobacillus alkaliphilus TaxID=1548597 RepID=A0A4Q0VNG3_9BACI|nr:ketopantoate reductase family protein [Anaerobacillus alkaliphilus]RXI96536.1 ketopantoate reductase family protein [Anaerobacillus alkaliphilus]